VVVPALQLNEGPLVCISETNVMGIPFGTLPGRVSLHETVSAAPGPEFVTVIVYGTSLLGGAAVGPVFTIDKSPSGGSGTVVPATPVLFSSVGSGVSDDAIAWFTKVVPGGVPGGM